MGKKKKLTEKEAELAMFIYDMGFEKELVIAAFLLLKNDKDLEKLLNYLKFKKKFASESDILGYCMAIMRARGERYQYLPQNLFVSYIKDTTDELVKDSCYQVHTVYGIKEEVYYLQNEKDKMNEYPASDFMILRPSAVIYTGIPDDHGGETEVTEGFVLGKRYNVVAEDGMDYILEDGRSVPFYETDEIEFVPAEVKQIEPVEHEKLLDDLGQLLEFGNMEYIYEQLTDNTVYIYLTRKI